MATLTVTTTIAALLAIMMVLLSLQVSIRRARIGMRSGVIHAAVFGDAGDDGLRNAIRAFGNFIEYAPMAIIMLALAELAGASSGMLWVVGGTFVAGRATHALAMTFIPLKPAPRGLAMLATYAALLVPGAWLLM